MTAATPGTRSTTPVVSVITPTYNRTQYLREALDSAVAQTFGDFELIVTDNAASSETAALVASYDDDRLIYRHNGGNVGALQNVIRAGRTARGDFTTLLHDDDRWGSTFLERLVAPLQDDPTLSAAFCDHFIMDERSQVDLAATGRNTALWRRLTLAPGRHAPFARLALVDRVVPFVMGTVYRSSAIDWDEVPDEVGAVYDLWLGYLACRDGAGAYYVPERLSFYRSHGGSLTSRRRFDADFLYAYSRFCADPRLRHLRKELRREVAPFHTGRGLELLRDEGHSRTARHELLSGAVGKPTLRSLSALAVGMLPHGRRLIPADMLARHQPNATVRY